MPAFTSPITPLELGGEMFQRAKTPSVFENQRAIASMRSAHTEADDTEFEDDSDTEGSSQKGSFESDDNRRRSQTTISSYDEASTPRSARSQQGPFEIRIKPVEGPLGPHLFRSSQVSAEFTFEHALQLSPLSPKESLPRPETAFREGTVVPRVRYPVTTDAPVEPANIEDDRESEIRCWTSQKVVDWMLSIGMDASVIECFEIHDINGAVLLDLQFDDLKELDIQSFGKRHQLWSAIADLRGLERSVSPRPTPFQDVSRPCTRARSVRRSPTRDGKSSADELDAEEAPTSPSGGKKRRGRKNAKHVDIISPAESISIVAIEQLLPRPHRCAKGERCAKWRKQQRELQQLEHEAATGRFPISPAKGGRIFIAKDPGNAATAENLVPHTRKQVEQPSRPQSEGFPSVVASSDLLGPGQLPEFALHANLLDRVDKRDPQDNVRQFLRFQHLQSPASANAETFRSPYFCSPPKPDPIVRSESVPLFPSHHYQAYPSLQKPGASSRYEQLRALPKLDIPRSTSAAANPNALTSPVTALANSICRSATASPGHVYRSGTPASATDTALNAASLGPVSRDASQSVPPNMQYRQPLARSLSRTADKRRPSAALPSVREGVVFSPASRSPSQSSRPPVSTQTSSSSVEKVRDPAHHSPQTQQFGYGADCTHAGWMQKRKTKILRHEWQDAHCRLKGTQLAVHRDSRATTAPTATINVDNYAVACAPATSSNKLSAAMKALNILQDTRKSDRTAFAFQLVPTREQGERRPLVGNGKTHHFAVTTKDQRIDWMREIMLAKALQQKGKGFDVEINGVLA